MTEPVSFWCRWQRLVIWSAMLSLAFGHFGCAEERRTNGSTCASSAQCLSSLCYHATCLDPAGNDDDDTLLNREEQLVGTNPFLTDSDGDFIDDATEVGDDPANPIDTDGDNDPLVNRKHDALESSRLDADCDCIPDQEDHASEPRATAELLAEMRCHSKGACGADGVVITATCPVRDQPIPTAVDEQGGAGGGCSVFSQDELCSYDAVAAYEEEESRCDGVDNDCDGETDEVLYLGILSLGDACAGLGLCAAPADGQQGVVECGEDGETRCSRDQGGSDFPADGATDELTGGGTTCDQLDNDCDGATDEDSPGWLPPGGDPGEEVPFGEPCDPPGACGVGHVECSADGVLMCSTQLGGSESSEVDEESCNTLDDDCDGSVDEGFQWEGYAVGASCADASACPSSEVVCLGGEAVCQNTGFDPPLTVTETLESCDGVDNDCDGVIDEEDGLKLGCPGEGVCADAEASGALCQMVTGADGEPELLLVCSFVDLVGYEVGVELSCNGLDDDCDGSVDEDLATSAGEPLGEPCMGVGACTDMPGVTACGEDGAVICKVAVESSGELCNGLDDDCDGLVDEPPMAIPEDLACKASGVCAALETPATCLDGAWICAYDLDGVVQSYEDTELSCDGLDNDCDGVADEGTDKTFVSGPVSLNHGQPPHRRRWSVATSATGAPLLMGGVFTTGQAEAELGTGAALGDVWRYEHEAASWSFLPGQGEAPSARYGHAMTSMNEGGLVLVHGGYEYGVNGFQFSDSLFVYQGDVDTWFQVPQTADQGEALPLRAGHSLTPVPDGAGGWQLILHGGKQGEDSGHTTRLGTLTEEGGQYALHWSTLPLEAGANPEPCRLDHGAVWDGVNERLVLMGGTDCGDDGVQYPATSLSLQNGAAWAPLVSEGESPPDGLLGVTAVADDARLYVVGTTPGVASAEDGVQGSAVGTGETHVWSLELATEEWTSLNTGWPSELEQVRSPAVWLEEGQLRVAGGSNDTGTDSWRSTWAYDLVDGTWGPAVPWAGPPPRVGAALVVRWDTGDTWLLGGVGSSKGKPLQDAWMLDPQQESWTTLESPLSPEDVSAAKTLPAVEGAAGTWDPVHEGLLLFGGLVDGEPVSELWAFEIGVDTTGYKELTPQGDLPPPMHHPSLMLAPSGDVAWLLGRPVSDTAPSSGLALYELALGSYTWTHLWPADGDSNPSQGVLEAAAISVEQGVKLVARTEAKKLLVVLLESPSEGTEGWSWVEGGDSSAPVYKGILGAALDPVGPESLIMMRGVDGSTKVLLADHDEGTLAVQNAIQGWSWPDGAAMTVHPSLGGIVFGGADSVDVTWGKLGVFAQTCP